MNKKPEQPFKLRANKPVATQLNKKVVISLIAVIVLSLLLVFTFALTQSNHSNLPIAEESSSAAPNERIVSNLPVGYQDADKIHALMQHGDTGSDGNPELQKEINNLKAQQSALVQQLQNMKNIGGQSNSPMQQEAMTSSIFFAGGAPPANANGPASQALLDKNKPPVANALGGHTADPYSSQNMQNQKADFLNSKPSPDVYDTNGVQFPASKYILQASSVIPAILQSEINSNLPGMITAVVTQNVYDSVNGQYLLIPKGSKLLGEYASTVSYGQYQLQAKFDRVIRPDGTSIVLPDQSGGVNQQGVSGFQDEVNNHWGKIIGAGLLMALFNVPAIVATNQQQNSTSAQNCTPTTVNGVQTMICTTGPSLGSTAGAAAWQSVGQAASQVGSSIAQKALNIQPTIVIHSGYQFSIVVTKDIVLPPYLPVMDKIPSYGS